MYSLNNIEAVRDHMQQLDDIFETMLDVHKENKSLLPVVEQERDEEWFDEVEHNICIFKQKIHCCIKDAELESSRRSHVSSGSRRSSSKHSSESSRSSKSSREEKALIEKIKVAEMMAEAKYMEEMQSLVFQTERLKVAEEMAKTKAQVQILEEPCEEILERKKDVTGMKSQLQNTFNHQNDLDRSSVVPADAKSNMVNMDSGASRQKHEGYPKNMPRQDIPMRSIGMSERSLYDRMKTWQPADVDPGNRTLSTDEDVGIKTSSLLCKLLQQQAAPEVDIYRFDGNPLNYHCFMALFSEVVETKVGDPRGRLTRIIKYAVGEAKELIKHCIQLPHDKGYKYVKSLWEKTY